MKEHDKAESIKLSKVWTQSNTLLFFENHFKHKNMAEWNERDLVYTRILLIRKKFLYLSWPLFLTFFIVFQVTFNFSQVFCKKVSISSCYEPRHLFIWISYWPILVFENLVGIPIVCYLTLHMQHISA